MILFDSQAALPPSSSAWSLAPSSLAQWVSGIGATLAVIVALFKDPITSWWRRPRLVATCRKEIPWTVRVPITVYVPGQAPGQVVVLWSANCYFIRLQIENTGRTRAEKVQVRALQLERRGIDHNFTEIPTTLPFNMKWSNSPPTGAVTVLDGISSRMSAFCDIISLCDPANAHQRRPTGAPTNVTIGQLQLEFELPDEWILLTPGTYRLTLRIAAANVEPIDRTIVFTHSGNWTANDLVMRRDELGVSLN